MDHAGNLARRVLMAEIQRLVCARFDVKLTEMQSAARFRRIARPRQVAMYLCRTVAHRSKPQIGRFFRRDHSTVFHACRTIERLTASDPAFGAEVSGLERELGEGSRG